MLILPYSVIYSIWKDMTLNDSLSQVEKSKLAVWDYPVSDKFTKVRTDNIFEDHWTMLSALDQHEDCRVPNLRKRSTGQGQTVPLPY